MKFSLQSKSCHFQDENNQATPSSNFRSTTLHPHPSLAPMDHRASFGTILCSSGRSREPEADGRGSVINFLGNPRFHPRVAFKMASTDPDMEERRIMLTNYAVVVKEEGPLGLRSCEELKDCISHHFGIRKHEFYTYRSRPNSFIVIFSERRARDVVFAAGRLIDGPIELGFEAWDIDVLGERTIIPFHVELSIEGLPLHAWNQGITDKILCEEAIVHHVEECSRQRVDQ
jgi:hypothetical protein